MLYMKKFLSLLLCALFLMPIQKVLAFFDTYEFEAEAMALRDHSGKPTNYNREAARLLREKLREVLEKVIRGDIQVDDPEYRAIVINLAPCFDDRLNETPYARMLLETTLIRILAQIDPLFGEMCRELPIYINTVKRSVQDFVQACPGFSETFTRTAGKFIAELPLYVPGVNVDLAELFNIPIETIRQGVKATQAYMDHANGKSVTPVDERQVLGKILDKIKNGEIEVTNPLFCVIIQGLKDQLHTAAEHGLEIALLDAALFLTNRPLCWSHLDKFKYLINGKIVLLAELINIPEQVSAQGIEAIKNYCETVILPAVKGDDVALCLGDEADLPSGLPPVGQSDKLHVGRLATIPMPERYSASVFAACRNYGYDGFCFGNAMFNISNQAIIATPGLLLAKLAAGYGKEAAIANFSWTMGHELGHVLAHNSKCELRSRQMGAACYACGFNKFNESTQKYGSIEEAVLQQKDLQEFLSSIALTQGTRQLVPITFEKQDHEWFDGVYTTFNEICAGLPYRTDEPLISGIAVGSECWADYCGHRIAVYCGVNPEMALETMARDIWITPPIDEQRQVIYDGRAVAYPYGIYRVMVLQKMLERRI